MLEEPQRVPVATGPSPSSLRPAGRQVLALSAASALDSPATERGDSTAVWGVLDLSEPTAEL